MLGVVATACRIAVSCVCISQLLGRGRSCLLGLLTKAQELVVDLLRGLDAVGGLVFGGGVLGCGVCRWHCRGGVWGCGSRVGDGIWNSG